MKQGVSNKIAFIENTHNFLPIKSKVGLSKQNHFNDRNITAKLKQQIPSQESALQVEQVQFSIKYLYWGKYKQLVPW